MPCFRIIQGVKRSSSPTSMSAVGSPQLYLAISACRRAPTAPSAIWLIESQSESWIRGGSARKPFKFRRWLWKYETLGIMELSDRQLMLVGLQPSPDGWTAVKRHKRYHEIISYAPDQIKKGFWSRWEALPARAFRILTTLQGLYSRSGFPSQLFLHSDHRGDDPIWRGYAYFWTDSFNQQVAFVHGSQLGYHRHH